MRCQMCQDCAIGDEHARSRHGAGTRSQDVHSQSRAAGYACTAVNARQSSLPVPCPELCSRRSASASNAGSREVWTQHVKAAHVWRMPVAAASPKRSTEALRLADVVVAAVNPDNCGLPASLPPASAHRSRSRGGGRTGTCPGRGPVKGTGEAHGEEFGKGSAGAGKEQELAQAAGLRRGGRGGGLARRRL